MDGILKSFEHGLQMLRARLEGLQPVLPIDIWRRAARALLAAPPQLPHALCDRDHRRLCRLWAWRSLAFGLSFHCSAPPDPLVGCRARGERERDQTGDSTAGPAGLDPLPQVPRLGAIALGWLSGSGLKSCLQGSAALSKLLAFRALHNRDACSRPAPTAVGTLTWPPGAVGQPTDWHRGPRRSGGDADGGRDDHAAGAPRVWLLSVVASDTASKSSGDRRAGVGQGQPVARDVSRRQSACGPIDAEQGQSAPRATALNPGWRLGAWFVTLIVRRVTLFLTPVTNTEGEE